MTSFDEEIPPGQVGYIDTTLDTIKLRGDVGRGISIETNDPQTPQLGLVVRAQVLGSVVLLPTETVRLSNRSVTTTRQRVLIRKDPTESGELRVEGVVSSEPWLRADVKRVEQPGRGEPPLPALLPGDYLMEVQLTGDVGEYGRREGAVRFKTGLSRQAEVVVPVLADFRPPVLVSSQSISLAPAAPDRSPSGTVVFTLRPGVQAQDLHIEAEPAELGFQLERAGVRHFKLRVEWNGAERPRGAITFQVGDEKIRLPVVVPSTGT